MTAPRVLMVVGHQPMVAVGQGTYLDDLLTRAHAANIADASGQTFDKISKDSDRDFYLNAKEAVAYGLADEIVDKI